MCRLAARVHGGCPGSRDITEPVVASLSVFAIRCDFPWRLRWRRQGASRGSSGSSARAAGGVCVGFTGLALAAGEFEEVTVTFMWWAAECARPRCHRPLSAVWPATNEQPITLRADGSYDSDGGRGHAREHAMGRGSLAKSACTPVANAEPPRPSRLSHETEEEPLTWTSPPILYRT